MLARPANCVMLTHSGLRLLQLFFEEVSMRILLNVLCLGLALLCCVAATLGAGPAALAAEPAIKSATKAANATDGAKDKRTVLQFDSTLKDDENKPVAGIFPMQFELRKPKQKKAFWKEKLWVAVDNGKYNVQLGKATSLPKGLDPKTAIMVVSIVGAGEILQEPLAGETSEIADLTGGAKGESGKRIVQYAEKSGFAYEAEKSAVAERIGNYTAKLLQDTLDALDKKKFKVKIGKNYQNTASIGGAGGQPFESLCPPGHVAVGIRGGSGIYIDNFQVICAPLE